MSRIARPWIGAVVHLATVAPSGDKACHAAIITDLVNHEGAIDLVEFAGSEFTQHAGVPYDPDLWLGAAIPRPCESGEQTSYPEGTWHWPVRV